MKAQWCVCSAGGEDAAGRPYGYGDGYKKSSWRLYGLGDTREDAEAMLAEFKSGPLLSEPGIAGSCKMYPLLEVREYYPLDFVSDQSREAGGYSNRQISELCERLAVEAIENTKALLGD